MIYVCIPVHDEARTVGVLLWKIRKVMRELARDYEILVLDDASGDDTAAALGRYKKVLPLSVIRSDQRLGYARALERLLREATKRAAYPKRDVAITLQGDFTDDPAHLATLVKTIEGGADVVAGCASRAAVGPRPVWWARRLAPLALGGVHRRAPVSDPLGGYRAYRVIVLKKVLREEGSAPLLSSEGWAANVELLGLVAPHARRIEEAPLEPRYDLQQRPTRVRPFQVLRELFRVRGRPWFAPGQAVASLLVALACASLAPSLDAQSQYSVEVKPGVAAPDPLAAPVPFGPGERLEYQVKLGLFSAGDGFMAVEGVDTIRGQPTYRLALQLKGGMLFAKVDDKYKAWLTTRDLVSLHFIKDVKEVSYKSFKEWAIYPEERRWQQLDENHAETMDATEPLDELSMLFWIRTLPLEVGETYTLNRYFVNKSNPVVIKVLRKELKKVPAGEFNTIVVQPIVKSGGLFGEGGKAELFFTDDAARHLVYMRSEIPVVGSVTLHLRRAQSGTPLLEGAVGGPATDVPPAGGPSTSAPPTGTAPTGAAEASVPRS